MARFGKSVSGVRMPISGVDLYRLFISGRSVFRHLDEDAFPFPFAEFEDAFESVERDESDSPVVIDKTLKKSGGDNHFLKHVS